jgi:uncharacterized membrane protein (Fun14 family)
LFSAVTLEKWMYMISNDNLSSIAATLGGGFVVGILIGWALKKVIKIAAVIVGLFLAGLAYLQYQQIATINWDKLQAISQSTITTIANATTSQIQNFDGNYHGIAAQQAMMSFGIPLTGSMATGFTIGFMKG